MIKLSGCQAPARFRMFGIVRVPGTVKEGGTPMADFFRRKEEELGVRLNDVQRQAVLQTEGPLLLLASPGSGKTTTIIMRIGFIIEEKGVDPSNIKAVTFSKASAKDMEERFARFFPQSRKILTFFENINKNSIMC